MKRAPRPSPHERAPPEKRKPRPGQGSGALENIGNSNSRQNTSELIETQYETPSRVEPDYEVIILRRIRALPLKQRTEAIMALYGMARISPTEWRGLCPACAFRVIFELSADGNELRCRGETCPRAWAEATEGTA